MIIFGILLITLGFLGGALATIYDPNSIQIGPYFISIISAIIGIFIVRLNQHKEATNDEKLATDIISIKSSLDELARISTQLSDEKEDIFVYKVHEWIDDNFPKQLEIFVEARTSIIHSFGLQEYAHVMNHFAAGERTINRAWSASVDGYIDEVHLSIDKANRHFKEALKEFDSLKPVNS